jgi:hypothetical protein
MRRTITFTLVFLVTVALAVPSLSYTVTSSRPRLFFLSQDVPELRAKCNGSLAADYGALKNWCDSEMNASLPLSLFYLEKHLAAFSFVWVIEQNPVYAERAKAIAQDAVNRGQADELEFLRSGSLFFDWCYEYLTASERNTFGTALAAGGLARISAENWDQMNNYHSKVARLREFAYTGLALYGAGVVDDEAETLCDMLHEHLYGSSHTLCCIEEIASDGSYFQGGYNASGLVSKFRVACDLWATATDQNPFEDSTNLQNLASYLLYETGARSGPGGSARLRGSRQGDTHEHACSEAVHRLALYNVANRYQDRRAQWMADAIDAQGLGYVSSYDRWEIIVLKDTSLSPLPPTDLPTARFFSGIGTVYMRTGWDLSETSNDITAVFRCERYPAGHTHAHQNHFLIARGGDLLAIDSGVYDSTISSHHVNYFERTIAHNCMTIYDPSESTFGSRSNDGGQIPPSLYDHGTFCGDASQPGYDRGSIVTFGDYGAFVVIKGDVTAAYAPGKVDLVVREFVYLKPDVFVILDRVNATAASFQKKWLIHSINEPSLAGSLVTIQEGDSKLFVRTLLPESLATTKVGGPGHEFEVNGVNYPPSTTAPEDAGSWRVEVSPTQGSEEDLFLHVLYVGDASEQSMPEVILIQTENVVGAQVGDDVVLFSLTGGTVNSVTYEYQ